MSGLLYIQVYCGFRPLLLRCCTECRSWRAPVNLSVNVYLTLHHASLHRSNHADVQGEQFNMTVFFLVSCKKRLLQSTVAYIGQSLSTRYQKNTAMLNWAPCRKRFHIAQKQYHHFERSRFTRKNMIKINKLEK